MSALASVEKRLEESERRLTELIQHLERLISLEKSLNDAGRGIEEASSNLGELAASTKAVLESLKSVVDLLQETVGILSRSNPTATVEAVARAEKELESTRQEITKAIDKVSKQVTEAKVEIGAAVQGESAETVSGMEATLKTISDQQLESQNRATLILYITLVLVVVIFGIEAIRLFQ